MSPTDKKPGRTSVATVASDRSWTTGEDCPNERAWQRRIDAWRDAVRLWLQWNSAYEQVTERMYQCGHDPCRLEDLMDQMDQLRRRAAERSRELLGRTASN
jgi:hypothetical protein